MTKKRPKLKPIPVWLHLAIQFAIFAFGTFAVNLLYYQQNGESAPVHWLVLGFLGACILQTLFTIADRWAYWAECKAASKAQVKPEAD